MPDLRTSLRSALGAKLAGPVERGLDLRTVGDLLGHYPRRYAERGELTDLAGLAVGDEVTVLAEVVSASARAMKRRKGTIVDVVVGDGHRTFSLTFFNQAWRTAELRPGVRALFAGKVTRYQGKLQLAQPQCQLLEERGRSADAIDPALWAGRLIPIYPATAAVRSWQIALAVNTLLDVVDIAEDPLPDSLRARHGLPGLLEALRGVHRPANVGEADRARSRLKWDEALRLQVALAQRRAGAARTPAVARPDRADGLRAAFDAALPFELTDGQRAVGATLTAELAGEHPMHRLLAGEVGSGKTVVALRAMLTVIDAGGQAALLAPTEVLASQHLHSLRDLLGALGRAGELDGADRATRVVLLTGSQSAAARREALAAAADGSAGIVVGTHALLSQGVAFLDLGLVVVDEQHRFGVEQRDVLRSRAGEGLTPHMLVMTATPIPRTVAITVFGDLDTSQLTELPRGRQPIATHVVDRPAWHERMWDRVREAVAAGRQAYVICPRIDPSDADDQQADDQQADGRGPVRPAAAVSEMLPVLTAGPLQGLRVGPLHGRMSAEDKESTMRRFARGDLDVLVATTVVEVGVDVPNATVMVVLDADRFGISQLHQLRGRIGRGEHASTCLLQTDMPAPSPAGVRLAAVAATQDGAVLARIDLEQRREGDVLGRAQSGSRSTLRLLRLLPDEGLIVAARDEAQAIVDADPELTSAPALARAVADMLEDATYLQKG